MKKYSIPLVILLVVVAVGIGAYMMRKTQLEPTSHMDRGVVDKSVPNDQPVVQSHRGYELQVVSGISQVKPGQESTFVYKIVNDRGEVLKDFATVHEKIMHFIVVRKDLQEFQHLHPTFNQGTGEFTVAVTFPTDGPYRLFPDFTPGKSADNAMQLVVTLNQDVEVGDMMQYTAMPVQADAIAEKSTGDYRISFATPNPLLAQSEATYTLTVKKNGQPVTNLENYLGALGHSVILKEGTLDFIHAHAEAGKVKGPDISFFTSFPEAGLYKTFTQFQHEGKVQTVDYTLSVGENTDNGGAPEADDGMNGMMH